MSSAELAALVTAILAGVAAVIAALAALVQAIRVQTQVMEVRRDVNGRLDQLLAEREERVKLAYQLDWQQRHQDPLLPRPAVGRADPIIRQIRPDEPKGE